MAQPYIGEIRMFAGNFPPNGWLFCEGQLLSTSEHETLFQLIGTTYGGDGDSTFGLPDLRGRLAMHQGHGFTLAETVGAEEVTLTTQQIPAHTHPMVASTAPGSAASPTGKVVASPPSSTMFLREAPTTDLPSTAISSVGGSQPHDNMMPSVAISYIISLYGIVPSPT